jgi:hypothetical protein
MSRVIISKPSNPKDTKELDLLLWEILWKPLSLPKITFEFMEKTLTKRLK